MPLIEVIISENIGDQEEDITFYNCAKQNKNEVRMKGMYYYPPNYTWNQTVMRGN